MHKTCADIIKWKPRMRCNTCEGRSIKDFFVNKSKNVSARRLSKSANKPAKDVRNS
jgi:hypothetical protein